MPIGSRHEETGLLLREGAWITLQRDDGGRWRLEPCRKTYRLLGQRVRVIGERCGFDILAVDRIERC